MVDTPKWVERWEKERAKGARSYILTTGIPYGLAMFVAMTFFARSSRPLTLRLVLILALVWALAGLATGAITWAWCERRYRKFLESRHARSAV